MIGFIDTENHTYSELFNEINIGCGCLLYTSTGGDGTNTFNISTTSAFVVAGAGLPVAKHGNRAISSKSGAGDVLEALGVDIMAEPAKVERAVEEIGIGFMFAPIFNKTMKNVGQARSEMGIRSIFNILGPLSNPSLAKHQVIGVFNPDLTEVFAQAMRIMGLSLIHISAGAVRLIAFAIEPPINPRPIKPI